MDPSAIWLAIAVALIGGISGAGGAFIGARVSAKVTRDVTNQTLAETKAARAEARQARFADQVVGLAVELLEEAPVDPKQNANWDNRSRADP